MPRIAITIALTSIACGSAPPHPPSPPPVPMVISDCSGGSVLSLPIATRLSRAEGIFAAEQHDVSTGEHLGQKRVLGAATAQKLGGRIHRRTDTPTEPHLRRLDGGEHALE